MSCKSYETLISAHIDRELTPEEERSVAKHLESCECCQKEVDELIEIKALCGQIQIREPSKKRWGEFSDRLLAALPPTPNQC